ncbi:ribosomal protein L7/L12 C-terminal domain-containing protein [Tribonema minus]|uniref:Ribosomal protein L7/L12 C-terminal domain-containing protein n=1 Tax=Tribonema minus TaxID=303371 RepID=A0A835Z8S1_9STRA|nr:ribosomal protein L7/L12 C-terminal domain-containing protein [Tribonema minus]
MIDLKQFINLYQKKTGITEDMVSANMLGGGGGGGGGGGSGAAAAAAAPVEEKSVFDVKLVSFDAKAKIKVIKEVRTVTGLGLKEAKELVEGAPKMLKKEMAKADAEKLLKVFKDLGAECVMD